MRGSLLGGANGNKQHKKLASLEATGVDNGATTSIDTSS